MLRATSRSAKTNAEITIIGDDIAQPFSPVAKEREEEGREGSVRVSGSISGGISSATFR